MNTTTDYADRMFRAYVECALWADLRDENGESMDDLYGPNDLAPETLESMRADVLDFLEGAGTDLDTMDAEQAGHDFWLTRNRHGAGFWDRGLGELGERLTAMAHPYGESFLYVGDDGLVYVS
jgi:hypothetical protein